MAIGTGTALLLGSLGAAGVSAVAGNRAAGRAADAQSQGSRDAIGFQRESRDLARSDLAPFRNASYSALDALMSMTGLPSVQQGGQGTSATNFGFGGGGATQLNGAQLRDYGYGRSRARQDYTYDRQPDARGTEDGRTDVGTGGPAGAAAPQERYQFQTDPGYGFRYDEGLRALNTNMAARGRSVGTAMDRSTIRYGQGMASQEYMNVYNRLAGIAGIAGAQGSASAALQSGANMGNAAIASGNAQASGILGGYAATGNAVNNLLTTWGQYAQPGSGGSTPYHGAGPGYY